MFLAKVTIKIVGAAGYLYTVVDLCRLVSGPALPRSAVLPVMSAVGLVVLIARHAWAHARGCSDRKEFLRGQAAYWAMLCVLASVWLSEKVWPTSIVGWLGVAAIGALAATVAVCFTTAVAAYGATAAPPRVFRLRTKVVGTALVAATAFPLTTALASTIGEDAAVSDAGSSADEAADSGDNGVDTAGSDDGLGGDGGVEDDSGGNGPADEAQCPFKVGEGLDDPFVINALRDAAALDPVGLRCPIAAAQDKGSWAIQAFERGWVVAHASGLGHPLYGPAMRYWQRRDNELDWTRLGGFVDDRSDCGQGDVITWVGPDRRVASVFIRAAKDADYFALETAMLVAWVEHVRDGTFSVPVADAHRTADGIVEQALSDGTLLEVLIDDFEPPVPTIDPADLRGICRA